jgi:hypothetical protein
MNIKELDIYHAVIRGNEEVRELEELDLIAVWSGGHTVNIYNTTGQEVDMFTFGWAADHLPTTKEFEKALNSFIQELT